MMMRLFIDDNYDVKFQGLIPSYSVATNPTGLLFLKYMPQIESKNMRPLKII